LERKLILQFSPFHCYFLPYTFNYFPPQLLENSSLGLCASFDVKDQTLLIKFRWLLMYDVFFAEVLLPSQCKTLPKTLDAVDKRSYTNRQTITRSHNNNIKNLLLLLFMYKYTTELTK